MAELQSAPTRDGNTTATAVSHPRGSHPAPCPVRQDLSLLPWVPPQRGESLGRAGQGAGPC